MSGSRDSVSWDSSPEVQILGSWVVLDYAKAMYLKHVTTELHKTLQQLQFFNFVKAKASEVFLSSQKFSCLN